jgi:hypothetical protein
MPPGVLRPNPRYVLDLIPRLDRPAAKIHILKPHRMKAFVESAQALKHVPTGHQEGTSGLFHQSGLIQIPI